ncbi:MAG: hypothetical protein JWM11_4818 [Planctomycetaceae bacterium]|nr:hypothetical protein [Planctomycetaceae bacterium]
MGLTKYLKMAFLNRWNLLVFLGGVAFSLLTGRPDIFLPIVLAGEISYLGFLGTHPKFQKYIEAQEAKASRQDDREAVSIVARRLLAELPKPLADRFEGVRSRCAELQRLARQMRDPDRTGVPPPLDDLQIAGLDRLLWMYLRLLFTQYSMSQFLKKTNAAAIEGDISRLEERMKSLVAETDEVRRQRLTKVVEENLSTSRSRLANYKKAEESYELMGLEIDRLENTIHSLSELAVNRQEPEFISGQIDQVANSMVQTERTMGELAFVTGLQLVNEEVPPMLRPNTVSTNR